MTATTKWFCPDCWRHGVSDAAALDVCQIEHDRDVRDDMKAYKIPAGVDPRSRNAGNMDRYPGVRCFGKVLIGTRQNKPRFKKPELPQFEFPEERIVQI